MNCFSEMSRKVTSSPYFDSMLRFAAPLEDLGINHFWYYQITDSGHYSYLGTNTAWSDYCFKESLLSNFPCLRHPTTQRQGISLMKASQDLDYKNLLETAWEKFNINFNINLISETPQGMEAFGFATCYRDSHAEERLLNELPLLRHFIKLFREKNKKLFQLLEENQVDLSAQMGAKFFELGQNPFPQKNKEKLLKKLGLEQILSLTPRELDILKFVPYGYPASFIADQLLLSVRTIENYLASIKDKLSCHSKVELIEKAQVIVQNLGLKKV